MNKFSMQNHNDLLYSQPLWEGERESESVDEMSTSSAVSIDADENDDSNIDFM